LPGPTGWTPWPGIPPPGGTGTGSGTRHGVAEEEREAHHAHRAAASLARERIVADPSEVVRAAPDIVIGSWCGKKFRPERVAARPGWAQVPAVRDGELHEVKSPLILQPGPAALTDGLDALHAIICRWNEQHA
jgi:hypothetical protein